MLALSVLVHAALATGLIFSRNLAPTDRSRAINAAALIGAVGGLILFLVRGSGGTWGTFAIHEGRAAAAGAAVFCAWLLVAATDEDKTRWDVAALVGAGSTAVVAFALTEWTAPAILFWICSSAALAVAAHTDGKGGAAAAFIGLSDVCVIGALVGWSLGEETWRMPDALDGWPLYLAVAGLILRAGVVPRLGVWELARGSTVAMVPLSIGGAFALLPSLSGGDEVGVALALLVAGMLAALWCAIRSPQVVLTAGWAVATMLAVVFIQPGALGKAASAAALAATAALLWPWTGGRAGPERGLLLAVVPLTVGFGPIVGAAGAAFDRSSGAESVLAAAPWTAFAALLPAALAVGVTMGAAMARRVEPETYRPVAVLATWAVAGLALVLGLTGGPELGFELRGELLLYVVAALAAAAAARFAPRQPVRSDVVSSGPELGVMTLSPSITQVTGKVGQGLIAAALLASLWFTYMGLKTGFL
jgi:hypothetical protein